MGINVGTLYIVATPIGNLDDITLRAIQILKNVDIIAAEDTRTTSILLSKYKITTLLESYHKFSEIQKSQILIDKIKAGQSAALVSDAGTPLISDPGNILVKRAIENNIRIVPIGGISACTSLISAVSRNGEDFKFIGFLPKTNGQIEAILSENIYENLVFYESPKRIEETLELIEKVRPNSLISIGRELTKKFEEIKTLTVLEFINNYKKNPPKGEFVCMLPKQESKDEYFSIQNKINALKNAGFSQKQTAVILEITDDVPKNCTKKLFLKSI